MATTEIEVVISANYIDYDLCDIVKKICEDHDKERNLRIKILVSPLNASDVRVREIVKEELDRRTADFISGFEKLNKVACHPSMTEFLHKQFPHNFKEPPTCNDQKTSG